MRSLSASELVAVWERGSGQHPVDRALTLLTACSNQTGDDLAALSIGQRDLRLLDVYEHLFGPMIDAFALCPECSERLEYSLSVQDLIVHPKLQEEETDLTLVAGGVFLQLRLPNSLDLGAVSRCADLTAGLRKLMERCVLGASYGGSVVPVETLPDSTVEKIAACLAEADPHAEKLIELTCAACSHRWQVVLDIECFLWARISALAKRLLREVHVLAQAYGWREPDILALSAIRRQSYLEMVGS